MAGSDKRLEIRDQCVSTYQLMHDITSKGSEFRGGVGDVRRVCFPVSDSERDCDYVVKAQMETKEFATELLIMQLAANLNVSPQIRDVWRCRFPIRPVSESGFEHDYQVRFGRIVNFAREFKNPVVFVVMDFISFPTLQSLKLDRFVRPSPKQEVVLETIAYSILSTMSKLHDVGVVHGDLHKGNILMDIPEDDLAILNGEANVRNALKTRVYPTWIIDFGLSKMHPKGLQLSQVKRDYAKLKALPMFEKTLDAFYKS